MKPCKRMMITTLVLLAVMAAVHAVPDKNTGNTETKVRLICSPELNDLANKLVEEYQQDKNGELIPVLTLPGKGTEGLPGNGDILLVNQACLSSLEADGAFNMVVGREVIVPLMNTNHPLKDLILRNGLSPEQFSTIFTSAEAVTWGSILGVQNANRVKVFIPGQACSKKYLNAFVGADPSQINGLVAENPREMISLIEADPNAIGFCTLACLVELEKKGENQGVSLIPLDRDGNGSLDNFENIYASYADLSHGIFVGKYPRELYSKLYVISNSFPATEAETAFLEWMISGGQQSFASAGILTIDYGERASGLRQLFPETKIVADVSPKAGAGMTLSLVLALCVFLVLVSWVVIGLFGRTRRMAGDRYSDPESPGEGKAAFPAGLFFDRSHTWTFMEKNGNVRIGVDDFVQRVCGSVSRVLMKSPGDQVKKGDALFTIVQQGKKLVIHSPVSGVVLEHNEELFEDASLLNKDPYASAWIYMVKPANWESEMKSYFMGEPYGDWLKAEFTRLKDFFTALPPGKNSHEMLPVLQDGGEIRDGALEEMGPEVWEEFQTRFINSK